MTDRRTFDFGLWTYRARLVRVIDGDTAVLLVDTGFGVRYEATIRITGIDAPEMPTPEGLAAADALCQALAKGVGGWPLRVATDKGRTGEDQRSFARYVGTIWTVGLDGTLTDVAEYLIGSGHAVRVIVGGTSDATAVGNDLGCRPDGLRGDGWNRRPGGGRGR